MAATKKPAVPNLFATAAVVDQPAPTKAKGKGKDKREITVKADNDLFAAATAILKSLTGIKDTVGAEIKNEALDDMIEFGTTGKRGRPDNFLVVSDNARTSFELRKRGSNRALSDEELKTLKEIGIAGDDIEKVTEETVKDRFYFNEAILTNQAAMQRISELIGTDEKLLKIVAGEDIIRHQVAVSTTKFVVKEETITAVFEKVKDKEDIKTALNIITDVALKPSFSEQLELSESIDILKKSLIVEEEAEAEEAEIVNE